MLKKLIKVVSEGINIHAFVVQKVCQGVDSKQILMIQSFGDLP